MTDPRTQADIDKMAASFGYRLENGQLVREPSGWVCAVGSNDVNIAVQVTRNMNNRTPAYGLGGDVRNR